MSKFPDLSQMGRLQQILIYGLEHWDNDSFDQNARRAFARALQCKTPQLGGRLYGAAGEEAIFWNTCRSPACASCGHIRTVRWQRERWCALPEAQYKVLTFTMRDTLWELFARNKALCEKLPVIAAEAIAGYLRVKGSVEAGVIPILHTFNPRLQFNSHVHALVMTPDVRRPGFRQSSVYFDGYRLMVIWKRLVIRLLRTALAAGHLQSTMTRDEVANLLDREEESAWRRVHVQRFATKEHFLRYAGRYLLRPPIAQRRILRVSDGFVTFWYKDKRSKRVRTERLSVAEFIDRWAAHIRDRHRHSVRYFGTFAPRRWPRVSAAIFASLGQNPRAKPRRRPWALALEQQFGRNPLRGRTGLMKFVRHLAPRPP